MSKVKKVYHLRKTVNMRNSSMTPQEDAEPKKEEEEFGNNSNLNNRSDGFDKNKSTISQHPIAQQEREDLQPRNLIEGSQLVIDILQLGFDAILGNLQIKEIKVRNIGSSAVYVEWIFRNNLKINTSAIKDVKPKFRCHHQTTAIRPGQETTFVFSFLSDFPGYFTDQVELSCQPPLLTPIPLIRLTGKAYVHDEWRSDRVQFLNELNESVLKEEVNQILTDIVDQVKLPPPPRPDVSDIKIAQVEFEKKNSSKRLYFNEQVHHWFNQLFLQLCEKGGVTEDQAYWDQSVDSLKMLIQSAQYLDDVDKKCFKDRLEHYCYLSSSPMPNKSQLYATVWEFVSTSCLKLGGEFVDSVRKQLDMWQIPFREPLETDTPEELKARKEEIDKVKAQWLKRTKKKKWGEQQERQLVNDFKGKVQKKVTEDILNRFVGFQDSAEFIKTRQVLKSSTFSYGKYHKLIERLKTVREYPLEGKKVMIKWALKLKQNCGEQLKALDEYLAKKEQQQKRIQEEKKNNEGNAKKKKAPAKPKKKGQKQEQEVKPLFFDFSSILDQECWSGFLQTLRIVMQKQPFLILIACSYGPRAGRTVAEYSVKFLLEHLKSIQPSIQFLPHAELLGIRQKIQNQSINQGSIFLMQNINFLPYETMQEEIITHEEGKQPIITRRKLLHSQIRQFLDDLGSVIDLVINEDRFSEASSGITTYLNREVVLGALWWKYVGLSMRLDKGCAVIGGQFNPSSYLLVYRLASLASKIVITGKIGLKFFTVKNNVPLEFGNVSVNEQSAIKDLINYFEQNTSCQLVIPSDFLIQKSIETEEGKSQVLHVNFVLGDDTTGVKVIDIGQESINTIQNINRGSLFLIGQTGIDPQRTKLSKSLVSILKRIFKIQEAKRVRHSSQEGTALGVNYQEDLVVYLCGIDDQLVEGIELKQKKAKVISEDGEDNVEQEAEEEQQTEKRKVELIADFRLNSQSCVRRLLDGSFQTGLKDISRYPKILQD